MTNTKRLVLLAVLMLAAPLSAVGEDVASWTDGEVVAALQAGTAATHPPSAPCDERQPACASRSVAAADDAAINAVLGRTLRGKYPRLR